MYKKYNILIIEDSQDDFEMYERIIKKIFPCCIAHFTSAEKALAAHEQMGQFDLALIDYNLPGMSGIDFLNLIKVEEMELDCPVIVLTGQGSEEVAVHFMRLDIADYISKSNISFERLSIAIWQALEKYHIKKTAQEKQRELLFFAHTLAHDLKSPISRMQAYAKLLRGDPLKRDVYLQNLEDDTSFLMEFIDKLLLFAECGRLPSIQKEVDLNIVLQKSINNLEGDIMRRNAIVKLPKDLPTVNGSDTSLVQLFQNILSNSIKYSTNDPIIEIQSCKQDDAVIVSILDNGIGIPAGELDNIFKPFTRISNTIETPGTGLGLALVKTIADQHQASVDVFMRKQGGSRFTVAFRP